MRSNHPAGFSKGPQVLFGCIRAKFQTLKARKHRLEEKFYQRIALTVLEVGPDAIGKRPSNIEVR